MHMLKGTTGIASKCSWIEQVTKCTQGVKDATKFAFIAVILTLKLCEWHQWLSLLGLVTPAWSGVSACCLAGR